MSAYHRNLQYLQQQFSALLHNTSPVITLICVVTGFGYLLSFSETAVRVLSVTPGKILPNAEFWIWTAFTFCFIELHWWEVLVDVITVGLCGKMLEPLWGQLEMFKFFALTNFGVSILTTIYYLLYFVVTDNESILFDVHIHGLAGYVAGICVAVRQIMPDHLIFKTRWGKLTNRNVPLSVLVASIIMWAINLLDGTYPTMFGSGLIVAWIYLRFYQWHPNGRGDSSESFTFASFFPNVMQPVIGILVNPIYICCLKLGVVKTPAPPRSSSLTGSLSSVSIQIPGADAHDVERRRQIALKALSDRLKFTDAARNSQLPKSFPKVSSGVAPMSGHHHKHQHHGHHHGHGHSHGHGHHSHTHAQGHVAEHVSPEALMNPSFMGKSHHNINNMNAPITTARAEPRMISTMSTIAIPMPAPPPPSSSVRSDLDTSTGASSTAISDALIDLSAAAEQ
ncbi:transmembrane protein 115 [Ceratitis capitata]|uniref:transmembrane protein 115 n=1 Tax=Ceratitis capitata TaxID=7213 RepID=UPI00032982D1|nr:transmembrane protein 115 [Ceratitis capitata]